MEFTFIDAVNDLCCLPFDSLEEAHGKIGTGPVIIDGRVGRLVCRRGRHGGSRFVDDGDNILQFFAYKHLPEHLQAVSKHFGRLAQRMALTLPKMKSGTSCSANCPNQRRRRSSVALDS